MHRRVARFRALHATVFLLVYAHETGAAELVREARGALQRVADHY